MPQEVEVRHVYEPAPPADTVYSSRVDTAAIDSVRVVVKEVGTLTVEDLINIICPKNMRADDQFWHNPHYGFVACPKRKP